jgi:hypothetical protein
MMNNGGWMGGGMWIWTVIGGTIGGLAGRRDK